MKCQLIQTRKIADSNRAEQEMLNFLSNLPAGYWVYREFQLNAGYRDQIRGENKKQPDFVVVAPQVGVVAIEVKDWDLTRNTYEWIDQYTVRKTDRTTKEVAQFPNPMSQADKYLYALKSLLGATEVFVTSLVAFPRLSKSDLLNQLGNPEALKKPQSRFYLDLERTLFKEDLDAYWATPEHLLEAAVRRNPSFKACSIREAERVNQILLPPAFRIGDCAEREKGQLRLQRMSQQQMEWVTNLDPRRNYLLDVPGSGKTNVLISKAIYTVDMAGENIPPRILLTTYSPNLEINIRKIFEQKIADSPNRERYRQAIYIHSIPALMEQMVATVLGVDSLDDYRSPGESREAYESQLRKDVEDILGSDPDRFRRFDHVFVDEIQDFDNLYLQIVACLCRSKGFFFVGDIGQKIYERKHDLERLGFIPEMVELEKSYKMYRTPRYIAELATRFILRDSLMRAEFEKHGYRDDFHYPKNINTRAETLHSQHPEQEIAERVSAFLNTTYVADDVLIITSEAQLPRVAEALQARNVPYEIGEPRHGKAVALVDFMAAKGLERQVVLVSGIEDLYERSKPVYLFDDEQIRYQREALSRRKVYVALTRTLEQLIVYYQDPSNRFVSDLLAINRDILNRW